MSARFSSFVEINNLILRCEEPRDVHEIVLREAARLSGADRSWLLLYDDFWDLSLLGYDSKSQSPIGREALCEVERQELFDLADHLLVRGGSWLDENDRPRVERRQTSDMACAVVADDKVVGVVVAQRLFPCIDFHPDDLAYLEALAIQLRLSLQRKGLQEALASAQGSQLWERQEDILKSDKVRPNLALMEFSASDRALDERSLERKLTLQSLVENYGDKKAAAAALGITLRNFYTKLESFGIPKKKAILLKFLEEEKFFETELTRNHEENTNS